MLTTHPLLVPRLRKSGAIPPLTLWVLLGLLRGSLYLYPLLKIPAHSAQPSYFLRTIRPTFFKLAFHLQGLHGVTIGATAYSNGDILYNWRIKMACCILRLVPAFGCFLSSVFVGFGSINMEMYVRAWDVPYCTWHLTVLCLMAYCDDVPLSKFSAICC
jgi:hypothetical protein